MATKSMLKNITLKDKALSCQFANALENAERKRHKNVEYSRTVVELKKDKIREFFKCK